MHYISPAVLIQWVIDVLRAWGHPRADARFIADTLVDANVRGIDSHGVLRLPAYARRVEAGLVDTKAVPDIDESGGVARVNGNGAAGQIAARAGVEAVACRAREHGVGSAVVRSSAHFGAAGYYARMLAEDGFIAFVMSNSESAVVPFGGRAPLLGTNPLAFAAPAEPHPLVVDMATSTVAFGKVFVAEDAGVAIPDSWGVDGSGQPTTDPAVVQALLPLGGPKGYGLAMIVETLCGVLSGAAVGPAIGNMYTDFSKPQNSGHWLLALDINRFLPLAEFLDRMALLIGLAHGTPPAPGSSGVLIPGEPEESVRALRQGTGIPIPPPVLDDLATLGMHFGHRFPVDTTIT